MVDINSIPFSRISQNSIFQNLSEEEIKELLEFCTAEKYGEGEHIFNEGDEGSALYIVASGAVKIYRLLPDNSVHEIAKFSDTEVFGEMSFMDNMARSASATAITPAELVKFSIDCFEQFSKKYPAASFRFHKNIISEIQSRMRRTNDRYSYHIIWGKTMKEALAKNYEELLQSNLELSASRNFLYNVINNSLEMIIALDYEQKVVIFNLGAEKDLKYREHEVAGRRIDFLFDEGGYQSAIAELEKNSSFNNREMVLKTLDGRKIAASVSAFVLHNSGSQSGSKLGDGIVFIAHNVTERNILERQILQNEKMIFLGKAISEIIHDIRNPLTIIQLSTQSVLFKLKELFKEDELASYRLAGNLEKIEESVGRIQKIMANTLDFTKVVPSSRTSVALFKTIERAISLSEVNKNKRDIDTIFTKPEGIDELFISGNESQLEQVFLNLIINSIQAIREGGRIEVSVKALGDEAIELIFKDNGSGIPNDVLPNVFEPFFTTKPSGEGTGLGLSICQAIVLQHGGTISCESGPAGTSFIIKFPLKM